LILQWCFVAVIIVALYAVLSPRFNYPLYRPLIFHPYPFEPGTDQPPKLAHCDAQEVFFKNGAGKRLCAWFFKLEGAKQVVLFSHGNAGNLSNRNQSAELLTRAGASVFVYDYSGFGKSEGLPTLEGICDDGLSAFKYLTETLGYDAKDIVVYGESLGAAVAAYISSQRECAGIIYQSGFASLRRVALEIFPFLRAFPRWFFPAQELDSTVILSKPHAPLLIIHGVLDLVVPYEHATALYAVACEPKELLTLPLSGHNDLASTAPNQYVEAINRLLSNARTHVTTAVDGAA
jgi:fermentation-respiration switch protein FrsA (DUF1100 family)